MAITAATHSDNASMWQKAGSSFASSYADTAFDYSSDGFKIGWNEGAGERALVAGAAGAAATTASHYAGLSDVNAKPAKDFDYSNSFTTGGYLDKMMTNTIESGAMSFYDMARHDLSWSDASKQNGFYGGMVYNHRDIGGFLGDRASVKVKQNYEEYRDQRAKEQQQEKAGLPVDAEDPFNGAEEMLFGLMDGLRRTEESFGNLFSGDGFNTDADLNNMDWETYDGYMKTTETGGADLAEYLQAKMRTGQELSYPEKQAVAQMAGSYGAGSMVAGFNGDYKHETDGQMAMLDEMGYDTEGLKGQVGQMRAVDQYNKALKAEQQRYELAANISDYSSRDIAYAGIHKSSVVNYQAIDRGSVHGQLAGTTAAVDVWQNQNPLEYQEYDSYGEFAYDAYKLPVGVGLSVAGGLWALGSTSAPVVGSALVDAAKWGGSQLLTQTMARLTIPRFVGSIISGTTTVGIDAMFNPDTTWEENASMGIISGVSSLIAGPVKVAKYLFLIGASAAGYKEYVKGNWTAENAPVIAAKMLSSGALTALTKKTGGLWKGALQGTFQSEAGNAIYGNIINTLFIGSPLKMLRKAGFYHYKKSKKNNKK